MDANLEIIEYLLERGDLFRGLIEYTAVLKNNKV